jgi:hypothetical protein
MGEDQERSLSLGRDRKVVDGYFRRECEAGCQRVLGAWLGRGVRGVNRVPHVDRQLAIVTRSVYHHEARMPDGVGTKLVGCATTG